MLIIEDAQGMARALATVVNPWLRQLLALRREQLLDTGLAPGGFGPLVIVGLGDTLNDIEAAVGVPVATNLVDEEAWPSPDFVPSWEWCQAHQGWHEIVFVTSDEGGGAVLFVPEREGVDPTLLAIIRAFGEPQRGEQP